MKWSRNRNSSFGLDNRLHLIIVATLCNTERHKGAKKCKINPLEQKVFRFLIPRLDLRSCLKFGAQARSSQSTCIDLLSPPKTRHCEQGKERGWARGNPRTTKCAII